MLHLPVINELIDCCLKEIEAPLPLEKTALIYIHHPLQTSINVIKGMISLGAKPENIFVLGKHYSECISVVQQVIALGVQYQPCSAQIGLGKFSQNFIRDINWLWLNVLARMRKEVEQILILDHGGCALTYTPPEIIKKYKVIGVEKTTAGLINLEAQGLQPFPIIGLANCAAKRILESPLIAEAIMQKLLPLVPINEYKVCGVVGYGAIGKAIANKLSTIGHKVLVFDSHPSQRQEANLTKNVTIIHELSALIASADYIFGCTGRDITATLLDHFRLSPNNKTLISCSSEDKEFLSLLRMIQQKDNMNTYINPLADIKYQTEMGATIHVLRGGFPVNFDNSEESVPAVDIQLTRALVIGSIIQATQFFKKTHLLNKGNIYKLDPIIQKFVINEWLKHQPPNRIPKTLIDKFQSTSWIAEHSGGDYELIAIFGKKFI